MSTHNNYETALQAPQAVNIHVEAEAEAKHSDEFVTKIGLLLSASSRGDKEKVASLLNEVKDPNSHDYDKRTGLMLAACEGHLGIVELLHEAGADLNFADRWGNTAMDEAAKNNNDDICNFLTSKGGQFGGQRSDMEGELINCAANDDVKQAERLLKLGINASCFDYDKRSALHLAVGNGNHAMIALLLKYNADPHFKDRWGSSPLDEVKKNKVRVGTDEMALQFAAFMPKEEHHKLFNSFTGFLVLWEICMFVLYLVFVEYAPTTVESTAAFKHLYPYFQDIHVMIFIGFGFLMTFLRKNGFSAVGFTFLLGAFCIQWHIIAGSFIEHWVVNHEPLVPGEPVPSFKIGLTLNNMIFGDFAAGTVLIAYGVLLGKVSHFQLIVMAIVQIIFYSINESILINMDITDKGGAMVIHMFGAFFGSAASIVLKNRKAMGDIDNASVYHSDLFAMIGTVFLWMFWPSFNSVFCEGGTQQVAIVNTVLSMVGSGLAGFLFSYVLRREGVFNMVDVQNATLAGGVGMGTVCNLIGVSPVGAVSIGFVSGFVSCFGYVHVQGFLQAKLNFHDTCGVFNLHGMPSIVGALAGVLVAALGDRQTYGDQLEFSFPSVAPEVGGRSFKDQALQQLLAILITLGFSIIGGCVAGVIMSAKAFSPMKDGFFKDSSFWETPDVEVPQYFDHRGDPEANKGHDKDEQAIKRLVLRLDMAEARVATLASTNTTTKLETIFQMVLAKLEKIQ